MEDLRISYIQSNLSWEQPSQNLRKLGEQINGLPATDLIILPEMFSTGFSMQPECFAESMEGSGIQWMKQMAAKKNAVVTGSLMIKDDGTYFNRLVWMRPDGTCAYYNKRHLFTFGGENKHYGPGSEKQIVKLNGWNICPLICYDLRFPVWSRNRWKSIKGEIDSEYDLLIYVANWPEKRVHPWKTLLMARAMENQAYVAGVNRIGSDGNGIQHSGDSAVIDFKGELLSAVNTNKEMAQTILLSKAPLAEFRKSFPIGMDADQFTLID